MVSVWDSLSDFLSALALLSLCDTLSEAEMTSEETDEVVVEEEERVLCGRMRYLTPSTTRM